MLMACESLDTCECINRQKKLLEKTHWPLSGWEGNCGGALCPHRAASSWANVRILSGIPRNDLLLTP